MKLIPCALHVPVPLDINASYCRTAVSTPQEDLERVGECEGSGCQPPPSHIIVYDDMATKIVPFLKQHVYELKKSYLQNQMEEKYVQLYARS